MEGVQGRTVYGGERMVGVNLTRWRVCRVGVVSGVEGKVSVVASAWCRGVVDV